MPRSAWRPPGGQAGRTDAGAVGLLPPGCSGWANDCGRSTRAAGSTTRTAGRRGSPWSPATLYPRWASRERGRGPRGSAEGSISHMGTTSTVSRSAHIDRDDQSAAGRLADARRTPAGRLPDALKPGIHCVRTHWIRGFMTFWLVRRIRIVMLMVSACPESGSGTCPDATPGPRPRPPGPGHRLGRPGHGNCLGRNVSRACRNDSFESSLSKHDFRRSDRRSAGTRRPG